MTTALTFEERLLLALTHLSMLTDGATPERGQIGIAAAAWGLYPDLADLQSLIDLMQFITESEQT